jgi:hypothetical protein
MNITFSHVKHFATTVLNFAWQVKQQRHCVADLPLYEYLRRRLTERSLSLGLIPLWALLAGVSDFLRLSADEYIHDSDQKLADRETVGQSYVEIVGGVTGKNINPILHTWFRDSCFTCDGSSAIQVFPLLFNIGMAI